MRKKENREFIAGLPGDVQLKLERITDSEQRNTLLDCLRRGMEIPEFAWQPIANYAAKFKSVRRGVECTDYRPANYWSAKEKPLRGSHTDIRKACYDVGEHLPELSPGQVEIARIALASTTGDVVSVRARRSKHVIEYSVVDEYETQFTFQPQASEEPLTLKEIIGMIDGLRVEEVGSTFIWEVLENLDDDDRDDASEFLSVHSDFYPGLYTHFERLIEDWARNGKR